MDPHFFDCSFFVMEALDKHMQSFLSSEPEKISEVVGIYGMILIFNCL